MRAMRLYAAFAFAILLVLGGCAADTKRQSEAQFNLPPDLSRVCIFQWSAEKASYRIANISGFAWTNAVNRGYPDLQSYLDGLFAECRHVPEMATAKASVSSHYIEYAEKDPLKQKSLSAGAVNVANYLTPAPAGKGFYVACVETTTPGGPRRAALAQGVVEAKSSGRSDNWPVINNAIRQYEKERLLQELTQQAWHKLWTVGQGLPAGDGCQSTLDALAK